MKKLLKKVLIVSTCMSFLCMPLSSYAATTPINVEHTTTTYGPKTIYKTLNGVTSKIGTFKIVKGTSSSTVTFTRSDYTKPSISASVDGDSWNSNYPSWNYSGYNETISKSVSGYNPTYAYGKGSITW